MPQVLPSLDLWAGLPGGLALFLLGMDFLTRALKRMTDNQMKSVLLKLTGNRLTGVALGAGFTALVPRSAATTGIMIVLAGQGVASLEAAIGVALGADIGTCVTALLAAIDQLHVAIVGYLGKIGLRRLTAAQSDRLLRLISVANDTEQIADLVSRDVVTSSKKRLDAGAVISPATRRIVAQFHGKVVEAMKGVVAAIEGDDQIRALGCAIPRPSCARSIARLPCTRWND